MKSLLKQTVIILSLISFHASAVTVIVHPSNNTSASQSDLKKIFLGKSKSFPDGAPAVPLDLSSGEVRTEFVTKVLSKSESQVKAYWSKRIFTGKGQPPKALDSEAEVIKLVSETPNLIGYVSDGAVTDAVKVLAKF
ncbi:phosphate ABC transporter substrate-binding protein [Thalassotalea piscium]